MKGWDKIKDNPPRVMPLLSFKYYLAPQPDCCLTKRSSVVCVVSLCLLGFYCSYSSQLVWTKGLKVLVIQMPQIVCNVGSVGGFGWGVSDYHEEGIAEVWFLLLSDYSSCFWLIPFWWSTMTCLTCKSYSRRIPPLSRGVLTLINSLRTKRAFLLHCECCRGGCESRRRTVDFFHSRSEAKYTGVVMGW